MPLCHGRAIMHVCLLKLTPHRDFAFTHTDDLELERDSVFGAPQPINVGEEVAGVGWRVEV